MRTNLPLDALLPKTRQGILAALLGRPEKAWYASELARRLGVPSSSLQRELQDLSEAGILKTHRQGRMAYYQANSDSPLFPELRGLLLKTRGLVDVLRGALDHFAPKLRVAFVYGSMASNAEQPDSDVDLIVVGSVSPIELSGPLRQASDTLGRQISPIVYSPEEFRKKHETKDHFLTRVLDKPLLYVVGNPDELGKLAGSTKRLRRGSKQAGTG